MAKKDNGQAVAEATGVTTTPPVVNLTLTYKRTHPKNRASYGISGVSGLVVVDLNLLQLAEGFPNPVPVTTEPVVGLPTTITVDIPLKTPQLAGDAAKTAKAEAKAAAAAAKAQKAQERAAATAAKAAERQAKAEAALQRAKAQAESATPATS